MSGGHDRDREPGGVTGPEPTPGLPAEGSAVPAAGASEPDPGSTSPPSPPSAPDPGSTAELGPSSAELGPSPAELGPSPAEPPRRRGRTSYQDETTEPRPPTLAEQRAHQQAERQAVEAEQARLAEEERQAKKRKRLLIGGGAVAGVAALVAVGYAISQPDEVEARCVDGDNVVVDDSNCVQPAGDSSHSGGGYYGGGFFPIFIGGGGRQYHYNYGGSGSIGQTATGGTTVAPKDATVKSPSGRVIQRGGFGVGKGSSSGSGSSGSSGS